MPAIYDRVISTHQDALDDLIERGYAGEHTEPKILDSFSPHGSKGTHCRPCLLHGLFDVHEFSVGDSELICIGCGHF